jgi:peptidoglycan/LPS O-acetylase OafA/YrhL
MPLLKEANHHLQVTFRKDINILRAFAVVAVILFHFDFEFAIGGYLGVDIFFVISGYLMTAIILSRFSQKRFSLSGFYISRFLRIVPALATLCLMLGVIGWFVIFPFDYAYIARSINHALTFKSNITYSRGTGYFETGADIKWLLHTWSLSVEMQFYLIYPLVLLIIGKLFGFLGIRIVLVVGLLASLAAYLWAMLYGDPTQAFYLLPTRAWQLLTGAAIVVFPIFSGSNESDKNSAALLLRGLGIGSILVAAIFGVGDNMFAPLWALLSTAGAALILATPACLPTITMPGSSSARSIAHYIGLISYSLYLWHWPIRSFQKYIGQDDNAIATGVALLITVIAAAVSYQLVEKTANTYSKAREGKGINWPPIIAMLISVSTVLLVYGAAKIVREKDGVVQRLDSLPFDNIPTYLFKNPELYLLEGIADKCPNNGRPCYLSNGKKVKGKNFQPDLILSGDSHAMAIAHALSETPYNGRNLNLLLSGSAACINFNGFERTLTGSRKFERCKDAYVQFRQVLQATPTSVPILFANFFPQYLQDTGRWSSIEYQENDDTAVKELPIRDAWLEMICDIAQTRQLYIMKSVPTPAIPVVKTLVQSVLNGNISDLSQSTFDKPITTHRTNKKGEELLLSKAVQNCGAILIDPAEMLCENDVCRGTTADVIPLYRDGSHLNLYGSRKLIPLFKKIFASDDAN